MDKRNIFAGFQLREHSENLLVRLNQYILFTKDETKTIDSNRLVWIAENQFFLNAIFVSIRNICADRDKRIPLDEFRIMINHHLKGMEVFLKRAEDQIQNVEKLTKILDESLKKIGDRKKESLEPEEKLKLDELESVYTQEKEELFKAFANADEARDFIKQENLEKPIVWNLNRDYELHPVDTLPFGRNWIWAASTLFLQDIKNKPQRLRFCGLCGFLFWDYSSKIGDRIYCYRKECDKLREKGKQVRFYTKHGPRRQVRLQKQIKGRKKQKQSSRKNNMNPIKQSKKENSKTKRGK